MTKAVPKVTAGTEQRSEQEGVPTGPLEGEPDPNPDTKQEPPGAEAFKSKSAQERLPPVRGGRYPTFWGRRIPTSPPEATKEIIKQKH